MTYATPRVLVQNNRPTDDGRGRLINLLRAIDATGLSSQPRNKIGGLEVDTASMLSEESSLVALRSSASQF